MTGSRLNAYFGFTRTPFGRDLAPGMLHRHASFEQAAARTPWCVAERAIGVITGEVGVGKTAAVRSVLTTLDPSRHTVIYIPNPAVGVRGIHTTTSGPVYVVAGSGVYALSSTWVPTLLGNITASLTTPVSMADNGITMVIVDGSPNGWQVTLAGNVFTPIINAAATGSEVAYTLNGVPASGATTAVAWTVADSRDSADGSPLPLATMGRTPE